MRLLLDTHILLDLFAERRRFLPVRIRSLLAEPATRIFVSVVSMWEIAIKSRLNKLELAFVLEDMPLLIRDLGCQTIIVDEHHVLALVAPEPPTRDPFDRLLLAQCQVEDLRLVTIDRALVGHPMADLSVR